MSGIDLAIGLTRAWVRLYTRGLPTEERSARRAELDSDLWEHAHDADRESRRQVHIALEVVGRLIAGVPADISWRREAKRGRRARVEQGSRSMLSMTKKHGMAALSGALGLWLLALAVGAVLDPEWGATGAEKTVLAIAIGGAGVLVLGGLVGMRRGRRGARAALTLGVLAGGLFSWWAVAPTVIAAAILVWLYAPRRWRRTPQPSPGA